MSLNKQEIVTYAGLTTALGALIAFISSRSNENNVCQQSVRD